MIVLKLWWSVFADKNKKEFIDFNHLKKFKNIIENINKKIILVHGTGNWGHWFVKNNWLNINNYKKLENKLKIFFKKIDNIFNNFERLYFDSIEKINLIQNNIIIWWYINKTEIISSDRIISDIIKNEKIEKSFILSDIDWVLDTNGKIIEFINKKNIKNISFWDNENDATWSMKQKVLNLLNTWYKSYILNWKNLENFENILNGKKWIKTQIN